MNENAPQKTTKGAAAVRAAGPTAIRVPHEAARAQIVAILRAWGVGANWYLNRNVKLMLDYDRSDFSGGSTAPGQVTAQDEQVIITRVQVSF